MACSGLQLPQCCRCSNFPCIPAPLPISKLGRGVQALVHPHVQKAFGLWKQPEASTVRVRFFVSAFGLDKDLFVAPVYILPGGSQQLHEQDDAACFQLSSDTASDALQHPYVIFGGHYNATSRGFQLQ